uniref:Uncharacterized protein n=1 Tax=Timema poppense TaxID=170557 RepID=A0A7R9CIV5_TIMPO|nr:unnamed protein product [Timema poppensis]
MTHGSSLSYLVAVHVSGSDLTLSSVYDGLHEEDVFPGRKYVISHHGTHEGLTRGTASYYPFGLYALSTNYSNGLGLGKVELEELSPHLRGGRRIQPGASRGCDASLVGERATRLISPFPLPMLVVPFAKC